MQSTKVVKSGPKAAVIAEVPGLQDAMAHPGADATETVLARSTEGRQIAKGIFSDLEDLVVKAAWVTDVARVVDHRANAGNLQLRCRN
jgi:hypothetical protein